MKIKKKPLRLKSRFQYLNAILTYHKNYYTDGGFPSIFSLQQKMLEIGICPRCGTKSRSWCSDTGHFPCWTCGFKITENQLNKVLDGNKKVLNKQLKLKITYEK